jgi:outer membrane protein assembly factor BamB
VLALIALIVWVSSLGGTAPKGGSSARSSGNRWLTTATGSGHLQPGSDPSVLPGPILIADRANNRLIVVDPQGRVRWQFPRPGDLARGQTFKVPDDAFFSPDGTKIIATEEDDFVISVIDIATHRIIWRYGVPGVSGAGPNHVWNPDDAMILPGGYVLSADIKNCRIILIAPGSHVVTRQLGTTGSCVHDPPVSFGSPNGAFPMLNGHFLVTEINGDWVNEVGLDGHVYWSTNPPGVAYPSDTNEISPNRYLTVDYAAPGQIVIFNKAGQSEWRFAPTGPNALDHPSLALPLPNGDILLNDDYNDRVIVVNPHTDRIVWQYGHTKVSGTAAGYLHIPDGIDLLPPISLLGSHASHLTQP